MSIPFRSTAEIVRKVQSGELKASDVTNGFLKQIQESRKLNAITEVNPEALKFAEAIDKKLAQGVSPGKLAGVPVTLKEMICLKGMKATAASKMLENFVSPYTATLAQRLLEEDAVIIGKCNQDEFAMGSSNEHSIYGPVKNPWNSDCVPGGSSGGSAAAVAAGMCSASIGTDTGGSIRQPAHFCGVVGLKPTYGRVSRYGVIAFASSLDQAGPLTNSVEDAALVLEVMAGRDERDSTSSSVPVSEWSKNLNQDLSGKTFGVPKQLSSMNLDEDTQRALDLSRKALVAAGAKEVDVELPMLKHAVPVYYLVAASEASSNLARYDGVRYGFRSDFSQKPPDSLEEFYSITRGEGFGSEVKRRIIMGTYFLSSGYYDAYFKKASQVRRLLYQDVKKAYEKCQAIVMPVASSPAFHLGEKTNDPLEMYLNDSLTVMSNLVGQPGISVPVAMSAQGLPIGIQILGDHFDEQTVLDFASSLESQVNFQSLELP